MAYERKEFKTKLRVGDTVVVTTGKWKGSTGKVERFLRKANKVVVAGVNVVKRHSKPSMSNQAGGIVEKVLPIHASNVSYQDKNGKPTKIGYKVEGDNKVRFCKTTGDKID